MRGSSRTACRRCRWVQGWVHAEQVVPDPEHERSHRRLLGEHGTLNFGIGQHAGEHLRRQDVEPEVQDAEPKGDAGRGCPRPFA